MIVEPRVIKTKAGRNVILRSALPEDAQAVLECLKVTAAESLFLSREADEVINSNEVEEAFLEEVCESQYSVMLLAEVYGEIAGTCTINPAGITRRLRHRCISGIVLYKKYWGQGIGRQVMQCAMQEAKNLGYEQCELEVLGRNENAIALYKSLGFTETGRVPDAVKYDDGSYDCQIRMCRKL